MALVSFDRFALSGGSPIYSQIIRFIKAGIVAGTIADGDEFPSRRALSALPERQREELHLKEIEGYPTREIAAMLGCDEAQVRVILSRGRMALRGILQKMRNDERTTRTD